jgi:PPM family protein phosphatase
MTDPGLRREANEDSFVVRPDLGLFVVADGVSRSTAGGLAAALAVQEVERCFEEGRQLRRLGARGRVTASEARGRMLRAFARAEQRVVEEGWRHPQHAGMLTTLAAMVVVGDRVVVAHLGDSRVYRVRGQDVDRLAKPPHSFDRRVERLTRDHNVAEDPDEPPPSATDPDRLSKLQALTRVIGQGEPHRVPVRIEKVGPDDTFLLCTDGVHSVLWDHQLEPALRHVTALRNRIDPMHGMALPFVQCMWIVDRVKQRSAPDNVTLIVARFRRGRDHALTQRGIGCVVHAPPRDETWVAPPVDRAAVVPPPHLVHDAPPWNREAASHRSNGPL